MFAFQGKSGCFQTSAFQSLRVHTQPPYFVEMLSGQRHHATIFLPHKECGELSGGAVTSPERDTLMTIPLVVTAQPWEGLNMAQRCLLTSGGMGFFLHAHLLLYFGAEGSNGRRRLLREKRRWMNRQRTQRTHIFTSYFPQNGRTQKPLITSEHIPVFFLWRNLANT